MSSTVTKLPKEGEQWNEIHQVVNELADHSERELVVVGCSILENALGDLLKSKFVETTTADDCQRLLSGYGPLASFSARIDIAASFGLIPSVMKRDMHILRKIRNRFAHTYSTVNLTSPDNDRLCFTLATVDSESAKTVAEIIAEDGIFTTDGGPWYLFGRAIEFAITDDSNRVGAYLYLLDRDLNSPKARLVNSIKLNWFFLFFLSLRSVPVTSE